MRQNCHRMVRLINNLMDLTKIDSGFLKPTMKNRDIISFIEDIVQSISLYINSKDIQLIFDTNVEEKIMAFDSEKVERIMLNLLSNAFKFTNNNGHIYVDIEDKGENIVITVKDNGVGIPENKLDIIFERFGQANRSLSRMHEGTGIGLYLVKSFIEMHEGTISVSSVEGQGTEFKIILPVKVNENEKSTEDVLISTDTEKITIEFSDVYSNTP
jgi:signal transduction histidine kinase